jgi:SAM-dependent methyltransferase
LLAGLDRLLAAIERGEVCEADVYRRERAAAAPVGADIADGVLDCPICGTRALRFLPFGLFGRRNARCPGCGSVERHRFLWWYLTRHTRLLRTRQRVLHTAPEPCLAARFRALPHWRYRSVDRFDPAADIRADLARLPLPDASVDGVISSHVLEHLPDDRTALRELARVVRPGGWAVVMVPYDPKTPVSPENPAVDTPAKRMAAYGHPFHYRYYGADLPDRLAEAGFAAEVVDSKRLLTPHQRRRFRINRNHLFACRRLAIPAR